MNIVMICKVRNVTLSPLYVKTSLPTPDEKSWEVKCSEFSDGMNGYTLQITTNWTCYLGRNWKSLQVVCLKYIKDKGVLDILNLH